MPLANNNMVLTRGIVNTKSYFYKQSDGTPVDMTGYTARGAFKTSLGSTASITLTTDDSSISINTGTGEISLTIDLTNIADDILLFDVELVPPASDPVPFIGGVAILLPRVYP